MYEAEQGYEKDLHLDIIKKCKIGIVEIGILNGGTTKIFLENTKLPVYGIDPIIPDSMDKNLIGDLNNIKLLQDKYDNFKFNFDYIFIDADHRYEFVKKDFLDWLPLLSINGYIAFHDSAKFRGGAYHWEGPSKFIDELLIDLDNFGLKYYRTLNSLTILQKIK